MNTHPPRHVAKIGAAMLCMVLLGCAGSSTSAPATTEARPSPTTPLATPSATVAETTSVDTPPPVAPIIDDVAMVRLTGPAEVVDEVAPEFTWSAVDGASDYRLVVLTDGAPVWAWQGNSTAVRLGRLTADAGQAFPTPELASGSTWSVVALDPHGNVLAVSDHRSISRS